MGGWCCNYSCTSLFYQPEYWQMMPINSPVKYGFAPNILQLQKYNLIFIYLLQCDLMLHKNVYCSSLILQAAFLELMCIRFCAFLRSASGSRWCRVVLWHVPAFSIRGNLKLRSLKIGWLRLTGSQKRNFSLLKLLKPETTRFIYFVMGYASWKSMYAFSEI